VKVVDWFNSVDWIRSGSRIAVILLVSGLMIWVARRLIRGLERFAAQHAHDMEARKRAATVSNVLGKVASVIIFLIALIMIFSEVGISIVPFLGAAGVAGVAIAFGAQTIVKDFLRGFFLLAENQIRQGDSVEIAGKSGVVEDLTMRYVQLRDYDGNVHYVPNGEITVVTNSSRSFAYAVVEVIIALEQDVEPVLDLMRNAGAELRANSLFAPKILDDLEIAGIEAWNEKGITLRARFKVNALEQANVRRAYMLRLKRAFDESGIAQPRAMMTLIHDGVKPPLTAPAAGGAPTSPPAR
jgi:small-conductance mechanosensitive channel